MWKLKFAEGGNPWLISVNNHVGRQIWEFDPNLGSPEELLEIEKARRYFSDNRFRKKHSSDLLMRLQFSMENPVHVALPQVKVDEADSITEGMVSSTLRRAINFHSSLQAHDGHWPGDYGGPMFLMPGLNEDGGWGLHIEGPSTMFGTVLTYVTLRLLGEGANDGQGAMERGRDWILTHGGATAITSWGKMWLSVLGVFEWSGNNPLPPEIWLLPYMLPFHPGRMWCHCRMVYLPMSYLYGKRFVGPITPTVLSLRKELYTIPYHEIDWNQARNECAKEDLYYPHPLVQDILWASLHKVVEPILMNWPGKKLREKALQTAIQHIHYEDENTRYICIGPVNKGYNGSQLWDTAFAVQAIISTNLAEEYGPTLRKANEYIRNTQVREDCPGDLNFWYRHISKGAWPFSTADHGWPISDCTAEGLKASLLLSKIPSEIVGEPLEAKRLYDAVNVILSLQNSSIGSAEDIKCSKPN
ncbi:Prenyltransferase/squalene oxidase [Corchorus olitorius]|uniref:Prenyltransferase/squalene oxidase n=1 Tax=Corchorus olitorius TaxID=93759 RepID=A0A1R3IYN9_9ROSI|nr:Prenyltransferase/squalene oxidase [Corchorus olitorius]